jgi:hypothetical protein
MKHSPKLRHICFHVMPESGLLLLARSCRPSCLTLLRYSVRLHGATQESTHTRGAHHAHGGACWCGVRVCAREERGQYQRDSSLHISRHCIEAQARRRTQACAEDG